MGTLESRQAVSEARDLAALLRQAAEAMPEPQRSRFKRYLREAEKRERPDLVPGTPFLPPITVLRPARPPRARPQGPSAGRSSPAQSLTRLECGWYYGEPCGCGGHHSRAPGRLSRPVQLRLDLSTEPKGR